MTIVIPYRSEVNNGLELRYALRSIEKYLSGWDEIFLITANPPEWFNGWCFHVDDNPGRKEYSIYSKMLNCCINELVSDDFIMWHDDHFLLQSLHVNEIKYWHNGLLSKELMQIENGNVVRTAGGRYRKAIENTLNNILLSEALLISEIDMEEKLPLNYDIHVPIIFNKKKFIKIFSEQQQELCVKSIYCYYTIGGKDEFMEDLKLPFQIPYDRLKEKIANRIFFSTDKAAIGPDLIRLWEELYPDKSKFEL